MASAAYHSVKKRMDGGEVILLDGAISTEIQKRGVPMDKLAWSGLGSKIGSETLLEVHKDYIRAGADVITTNTFSSARHSLKAAGREEETREVNAMAVALAKQAVEEVSEGRTVLVAGSISPFGAYNEITGFEAPPLDIVRDSYREQAQILAEEGVDLFLLEMLRDVERASVIVEAALATGMPVWSGLSSDGGGGEARNGFVRVLRLLEGVTFEEMSWTAVKSLGMETWSSSCTRRWSTYCPRSK